ncbi:MAG: hypothetical protein SVW77_02365 [Candidatus Nanohaloarchaea archaeon]|nr:hypothetical protein [Candidatus Nanohaloarchaea archaeon]
MCRSRNGQIFTIDMVASILVFMLIVNLSLITWNLAQRNSVMFNEDRALRDRAERIADLLVRGPGVPENWTADTVELVGLADPDHVLSNEKLDEFDALSYQEQTDLLRTRGSDVHLNVSTNGSTVEVDTDSGTLTAAFGTPAAADAETVAVSERRVLVNTSNTEGYEDAVLELVLWR